MIKLGYKGKPAPQAKGYLGSPDDLPESFSLDEDDLKDITSWKVGASYDLKMTVKLVSQSQDATDKTMRVRFEIQDVQPDDGTDESDGG